MRTMRVGLGIVMLSALACGGEAQKSEGESSSKPTKDKTEKSARAAKSAAPSASAATTGSATAAPTAAATAAPAVPATLATLFDGPPDAAVALAGTKTVGRATVGLPADWTEGASWDSVDSFGKKGGAAKIVVLRLDISEAYLDSNVATWVKVPFQTGEVKWEPREATKLGKAQLEAKVAKGSGSIGKDEAEFWQVATGIADKKYGLVVIAGVKKSADEATLNELVAVVRSIEWK